MTDSQVEALVKRIQDALPGSPNLQSAVELAVAGYEAFLPGFSKSHATEIEQAQKLVEKKFENVEILHKHSIIKQHEQWYFGPSPSDRHWPALKSYLLAKGWDEGDVERLDDASTEIVSLLGNPSKKEFLCRGLVVGHVQSGKTANMTAVIAKALDTGYDTVIVLAGLTNKLRYQTQLRLFQDLVQRNELEWNVRTPNEEDVDFRAPPQGGFLSNTGNAQIAVVKKNVSPLKQLRYAVEDTNAVALRRLRVLVIDDECDQASVNASRDEMNVTVINEKIRDLLEKLPAVTYIGYTATPFANVLIDPYRTHEVDGNELDDLYPRDFITALPTSSNYFGTEKLFGRIPDDPENIRPEEEGLDMIREIPEDDEAKLKPSSAKARDAFVPEMTESLEDAVLYFLACCAARRARGDHGQHMTMLIHTSAYVVIHERVADCVQNWVKSVGKSVRDPSTAMGQRLAAIWEAEQGRLPEDITSAPAVMTGEVFEHIGDVLDALEFPVENGASDDRLSYNSGTPKTYIVVGGSILARGLTLEGLMVSYFLRTANQYDTLLQMGRWFGYRRSYEDLPRIWMPNELKLKFRHLAKVEMEIREDIGRYQVEKMTPMDVAVRIRSIPGMAITGATKMRAAKTCAISFWGTHRQTFRFHHLDADVLNNNWQAAAELLEQADSLGEQSEVVDRNLWMNVPKDVVLKFLSKYRFHPDHADLQPDILLPFIQQPDNRLRLWNVGIVESGRGEYLDKPLGILSGVRPVRRAKLTDTGETADIKALMSKRDVWFDCDGKPEGGKSWEDLKDNRKYQIGDVPLLLLYPIDSTSKPRNKTGSREPLNAVDDVMGVGIVFPGLGDEEAKYVSVELQPISADEIEDIDAEEAAQLEAAGVK